MTFRYDAGGVANYDSIFAFYDLLEVAAVSKVMKTVINMDGLTPDEKVTRAQSLHASLTGNANFPTPNPTLTAFQSAITEAQAAIVAAEGAIDAAREAAAAKRAAVEAMMALVRQLAAYVENTAEGDEEKILSSGFEVRAASNGNKPNPSSIQPAILVLAPTANDGELRLRVQPISGAQYYEVFVTATPANGSSWDLRATDSRSSILLTGLPSGTKMYVRVRAKLRNGFTGFSAEAGKMVP